MNKFKILILISIAPHLGFGQQNKIYSQTEIGYLTGIGNINYDDQNSFANQGKAYRLRTSLNYFFHDKTSVGLGLGLDGYHDPTHNTFPVFIDLKRWVLDESFYAMINYGYTIKINPEFDYGQLFAIGVGYKIQKNKIAFVPSIAINYQQLNGKLILFDPVTAEIQYIESTILFKSIAFNIGILF